MEGEAFDPQRLDEEAARRLARAAGAYFAARRSAVTKRCAYCGKVITGLPQKKYCGPSCSSMAWQKRNRETYLARRRERERRKRQERKQAAGEG